jgi:hypothetical protein
MPSISKTSARYTGHAAPRPIVSAPIQPPNFLKKILPAWELAHDRITETSRGLRTIDTKVKTVATTVAQLPDSDIKEKLTEHAHVLQTLMTKQLKAKRKEFEMSKRCLTAFNETQVVPNGNNRPTLCKAVLAGTK